MFYFISWVVVKYTKTLHQIYIIHHHHQLFSAGCNVHLAQSCPGLFLYFSCSNRKFSLVISPQLSREKWQTLIICKLRAQTWQVSNWGMWFSPQRRGRIFNKRKIVNILTDCIVLSWLYIFCPQQLIKNSIRIWLTYSGLLEKVAAAHFLEFTPELSSLS